MFIAEMSRLKNIVQKTVYVEEVTEQSIMEELGSALNLDPQAGLKDISFGTYGGDKVVMLDFNQAFADYLKKIEPAG